ncbi:copper homeostasis protein CutC [Vibrio agarivorans]|uniref:copper homeostasis protein CutC n=1 Tax=Vibrio agarivorans TaxID=153622 RepID=UPI002230F503|nr:copper homeostasis protein CutC [Vibrio agarivorans]
MQVEVCIDHLESLPLAIQGGANRIEMCSSLELGGLTPSYGLMCQAAKLSTIPVYAMIRPRQGDFLCDVQDIELMCLDIEAAAQAGLQGIVTGVLTADGHVDLAAMKTLVRKAHDLKLGVTFHRAIDQCADMPLALEQIIELGCERVLTSGQARTAQEGIEQLNALVKQAQGRISIMAGAGVNADNAADIVARTNVTEVHLSGKTTRPSQMMFIANTAQMGSAEVDDFVLPITNPEAIRAVVSVLSK